MNVLCTFCLRAGSKGIRNKNFLLINKKPLFQYTFNHGVDSKIFSHYVVSSDKVSKIKKHYKNKDFLYLKRPKVLSGDRVGKVKVIRHALLHAEKKFKIKFDFIFDLDITSPLRNIDDIKNCFKLIKNNKSNNLITICEAKKNPYFNLVEIEKGKIFISKKSNRKVLSRQQAPKVYEMNASIYGWKREYLIKTDNLFSEKTSFYFMPHERSIDIDDVVDFKIVEMFLKNEK